ncbi:MAG: HlyD family efflux transporter periplasmic adaptor subunit [Lentisphaeria bacterium]|nr:HlyD family efflux transporter periplasmic adaptor subunit [Lentisphaeria bacterium]
MKKQTVFAIVIFIAIIAATVFLVKTGPKPMRKPPQESVQKVTAVKAAQIPFCPVIHGFGEAMPDKTWSAITQISGKIIEINPGLQNGKFLHKGDLIAKIDDTEYRLAIDKAKAEAAKIQADMEQLNVRKLNLASQKAILDKMLTLNKKNLERNRILNADKNISDQELEKEELTVLQQENTVTSLQAEINLIPAQISAYEAQAASAAAALKQAELNASYAVIIAPFDGRVSDVNAELLQFASTGTVLCKLDSIDKAEIETSIAPDLLAILPPNRTEKPTEQARTAFRDRQTFTVETASQEGFSWPAKFLRFSEKVDPNTRMVGLVIGVDKPYGTRDGTPHLPLSKGLFCKVSIKGSERSEIVLPRYAIHEDSVYVVDDGKLVIRPVVVKYNLGAHSIIEKGVNENDIVVTSDIVPVIAGMKLDAEIDEEYATKTQQLLNK